MSKSKASRNGPGESAGLTRREFLRYSAAAGALAGSSPFMATWANELSKSGRHARRCFERHTLFFNFAHEPDAVTARYFLVAGKRRYRLRPVKKHAAVLSYARKRNRFLRQVPDEAFTHVVSNAAFSADSVQLCYVIKDPDTTAGTWSMSSMFFQLPSSAVSQAYKRAVGRLGAERLPLSAKRQLYGIGPAMAARDLLEEEALKDCSDHATAIIAVHPELLSAEPNSAVDVQKNFIASNGATFALSIELQEVGPAQPQVTPNESNSGGWATLTPITDDDEQPFINQNGNNKGLIQYHPDWNPQIATFAGAAVIGVMNPVKNDPTLGGDVTGLDPSAPGTDLAGRIWQRHDGFTTVDQSPVAMDASEDALQYTLTTQNFQSGYRCTGSASAQSDGTIQATLTVTNWYVRWLGVYLLFLDANDNPLDASGLPVTTPSDYDPGDSRAELASEKALFGLLLGPEFTLLGIPIENATATLTFDIPEGVSKVRVFASGPSLFLLAPPDPDDPSTWGDPLPGFICTALLNYGLPILLMAAGASDSLSPIQKAALPFAASIAVDATNLIGDAFRNQDFGKADVWAQVGKATLKAFLTGLTGKRVANLASLIALAIAEGEAEDAIPIAGQVALGVSLTAGVATLLETTLEIAASPVSYVYDLALTHDLSVTIQHDPNNDQFPAVADYYKVTVLFDNGGTPHVQTLDMPGTNVSTLPAVIFKNVPEGGKVNVSVGFYSRATDPTQNDWLAGKGTSGIVDNTVGQEPNITIEQFEVPIQSNTAYEHKQKTTLDAQGNHLWAATPAPTVKQNDISCGGAGTLCEFRSITVRQGTSKAPGYVGYAWQGFSTDVDDCTSGGQGQLDQLANLGSGTDPQQGYVTALCGLQTGAQLSYSLLTLGTSNFYLDSTNKIIRQVRLDPTPEFDDPTKQQAWGALNLDSETLLLHPSGRLVSINNANSKIEVLKIPDAPMSDEEAKVKLLADVYSGQGSRPGLIDAPCAAAVSPEGMILILEDNNSRLQAFDLGGNPVRFFTNQQTPYFLNLDATTGGDTIYLDLAVEFTGYLYVLSFNQSTNLYRLDIYHQKQTDTDPISTTQGVNAAKLTVDFWRNVYTLNYELLQLPDGTVPSITEPSVSLWVPSTPS